MNVLPPKVTIGTIGEVLVQLKLLICGVESFPPLKDSGNDLIGFFGTSFCAIQVKTKQDGDGWKIPEEDKLYHILALVDLDKNMSLDNSKVYLLTREEATDLACDIRNGKVDDSFLLSSDLIAYLRKIDGVHHLSHLHP